MSSKQYPRKFRLDMNDYDTLDNHPNEVFREDMQELRLEKLSQRVTLITILIPILIAVIITVSYLDIKQRVIRTQTTGTIGVQNLSKDLESRFSSLSVRQAKLEDEIEKQLKILDKNRAEYAIQKKRLEDKLTELYSQSATKKELSEATTRLNTSFKKIKEEVAAASNNTIEIIKESNAQGLKRIATLQEETRQNIDTLSQANAETSNLVAEKLDKNQLDVALKIRDLKLEEQFQRHTKNLEQEILQLKEKNNALNEKLKETLNKFNEISKSTVKQESRPNNASAKSTPPAPSTPKGGKIVEQNLN